MRKATTILLLGLLCLPTPSHAGVRGNKSKYIGGTLDKTIPPKTDGHLTLEEDTLRFNYKGRTYDIPYRSITYMEYGPQIGHRIGAGTAVAAGLLVVAWPLAPVAIPLFLSKKKKHFLSMAFDTPEGPQAIVFEISKKEIRPIRAGLEAKTGKLIAIQSEKAIEKGEVREARTTEEPGNAEPANPANNPVVPASAGVPASKTPLARETAEKAKQAVEAVRKACAGASSGLPKEDVFAALADAEGSMGALTAEGPESNLSLFMQYLRESGSLCRAAAEIPESRTELVAEAHGLLKRAETHLEERFSSIITEVSAVPANDPVAPAGSCLVSVESIPDGADIEMHSVFLGTTPSTFALRPGEYEIVIKKKGYKKVEKKLMVTEGGRVSIKLDLEKD